MAKTINVTIWNEYRHEKSDENVAKLYPNGLHAAIGEFLSKNDDMKITLAALDDPDQGLPDEVLNNTDVLLWWGHMNHGEVKDDLVERIRQRVYVGGMGFIALHSAHHSKPFRAIVGTTGNLLWGDNQKEIIWNIMPSHPIAAGIPAHFELPEEELYAEPFQIPQPDAHIFEGWYEHGRVFYFQPGHETCPSFYDANVQRIITNGVRWAAPNDFGYEIESGCPYVTALV